MSKLSPLLYEHKKIDYLNVSEEAVEILKNSLNDKVNYKDNQKPVGIKIVTPTKGCGGLTYQIEYAYYGDNLKENDELLELGNGVRIFVSPESTLVIFGTTLSYQDNGIEYGFYFKNPNEKGQCGCGDSFYV